MKPALLSGKNLIFMPGNRKKVVDQL